MRKVLFVVAVAMLVSSVPVYSQSWVGPPPPAAPTDPASWQVAAHWTDGILPTTAGSCNIRGGGTAIVDTMDCASRRPRMGYYTTGGAGHIQIVDGGKLTITERLEGGLSNDIELFGACTVTQTGGLMDTKHISMARIYANDPGWPVTKNMGWTIYTISGGTIDQWYTQDGFANGSFCHNDGAAPGSQYLATGDFIIVGDQPVIGIAGVYTQEATSSTEFQLTSTGTVSQIDVGYNAYMSGTLKLDASAYTPTVGDKIPVMVVGNKSLQYKELDPWYYDPDTTIPDNDIAVARPDMVFSSAQADWGMLDDGLGTLSVKYVLGDVTESGYVDGSDLDEVLAKWGQTQVLDGENPRWVADVTCDEFVDGNDLDYILAGWGKGTPPPVPEPITLTLLGFGGLALLRRRRR